MNRALNHATGIKQLLVRGQRGVSMAIYLKTVDGTSSKPGGVMPGAASPPTKWNFKPPEGELSPAAEPESS